VIKNVKKAHQIQDSGEYQVKFVVNTHSKKSSLEKLDSFDLILKIF
jgi:hypothetical protein